MNKNALEVAEALLIAHHEELKLNLAWLIDLRRRLCLLRSSAHQTGGLLHRLLQRDIWLGLLLACRGPPLRFLDMIGGNDKLASVIVEEDVYFAEDVLLLLKGQAVDEPELTCLLA